MDHVALPGDPGPGSRALRLRRELNIGASALVGDEAQSGVHGL